VRAVVTSTEPTFLPSSRPPKKAAIPNLTRVFVAAPMMTPTVAVASGISPSVERLPGESESMIASTSPSAPIPSDEEPKTGCSYECVYGGHGGRNARLST